MKINPYNPSSPVPVEMFTGRQDDIRILEQGLYQTKMNKPSNYLIIGERGIGKSSLLLLINSISKGSKQPISTTSKFNFISVNVIISDKMNLFSFLKLISNNFKRELGKVETLKKFFDKTWDVIQRIKVMDSGIEKGNIEIDPDMIINDFAFSISETCQRISNPQKNEHKKDGVVFIIDEADNATADLNIGYFLKAVTELLQQNSCYNVMFIMAGLPNVKDVLTESHPSSLRIFKNVLKIDTLEVNERYDIIDNGIHEGNKVNTKTIEITIPAKQYISALSEGYPHFIQQFSYSAFDFNTDDKITKEDVINGAFKERGAIDVLGERYYATNYYNKIKSDEYREVLEIMADNMSSWIKKKEIRQNFSGDDQTLTNALATLTKRSIIIKNPSKIGEYRLQQRGFAIWIKLFGKKT